MKYLIEIAFREQLVDGEEAAAQAVFQALDRKGQKFGGRYCIALNPPHIFIEPKATTVEEIAEALRSVEWTPGKRVVVSLEGYDPEKPRWGRVELALIREEQVAEQDRAEAAASLANHPLGHLYVQMGAKRVKKI
jgi:hypothetical protein